MVEGECQRLEPKKKTGTFALVKKKPLQACPIASAVTFRLALTDRKIGEAGKGERTERSSARTSHISAE